MDQSLPLWKLGVSLNLHYQRADMLFKRESEMHGAQCFFSSLLRKLNDKRNPRLHTPPSVHLTKMENEGIHLRHPVRFMSNGPQCEIKIIAKYQ
ncbi:hypothetical protein IPC442_13440 [Pseudomonas aeruginosa]|nr:hypothetical protein A6747_26400 [Pseudomonas aeruginosa]ERU90891.1 hypothetical protein Q081_05180 [Pseudomonas aeruginosa M8A.2]ERX89753.1 hypothetical protein Q082_03746 [Pseudomonas aeruginosa M8A.3]EZO03103.1 hypothetical protein AJ66_02049 [Pseudomonas aeruginosa 3579]EZO11965.1 hypothetical protein AJ65_03384 [Pseudomonas aeruginosa 3578]